MSDQEQALVTLARALDAAGVPYMVIGGYANAVWGEPRATLDIDLTVWWPEDRIGHLLAELAPSFEPLVADPAAFVEETRVLPFTTPEGLRIDMIFGLLPFEETAIQRAVPIEVGGAPVRFVTAEDLILLKIVSTRERDLEDVRGVVKRRLRKLDLAYLEPRIQELAQLLDRPEILEFWKAVSAG